MISSPESHRLRLAVIGVIIVSIFLTLVARLWYLQVLAAPELRTAVEQNRTRELLEPAPRGRLYDRLGRNLADNRLSVVVVIDPEKLDDPKGTYEHLAALLTTSGERLTAADIQRRAEDPAAIPYLARAVATDVRPEIAIRIKENPQLYKGVSIETRTLRSYADGPAGSLAPHLIGYLGEASPDDLEADPDLGFGDIVGRGGLEQQYQHLLKGEKGVHRVQVDALGRPAGGEFDYTPPMPGLDLSLTIDADVQRVTEEALERGLLLARGLWDRNQLKNYLATAGAAVVLDVRTGGVVASASFPQFDLNAFATGDDLRILEYLDEEKGEAPLNDRAVGGLYPPASAFKPFMAVTALELSMTAPSDGFGCGGYYIIPGDTSETKFWDWNTEFLGTFQLDVAIIRSCDVAFYTLGTWIEQKHTGGHMIARYMHEFGLGAPTGIDLPLEAGGRVPDQEWKQRVHEQWPDLFPYPDWFTGDAVNTSIGQGDVIATPLQMAVAYAAIVNGGDVLRPHVLDAVVDPSTGAVVEKVEREIVRRLPIKREHLDFVTRAMMGVITHPEGTGSTAFQDFPFDRYVVGGKTGTAEIGDGTKQDTAWFVGFVGRGQPDYVVAVVLEEGGHGGSGAAPVARVIMEALMGENVAGDDVEVFESEDR